MTWLPIEIALLQLGLQAGLLPLARALGRPLRRGAIVCGLLAPWVLLAPWLFGDRLLVPCELLAGQVPDVARDARPAGDPYGQQLSDAVLQFLPWELEVRHALAGRRLPLWSDRLDGGSSPWSNPQAGVLSPIAWLARAVPIQHFLLAMLVFKLTTAAEGLWLLGRALGARSAPAALAGLGYAGSGALVAWGLFPHSAAAAWLPWLAAGCVRLMRRPGRWTLAATSFVVAAVLLSGQPEVAAAAAALAALCALLYRRRRRGTARRGLARIGAAALLGLGLAAPIVVPFLALLPRSQRAQEHIVRELPEAGTWRDPGSWFIERKGHLLRAPWNPYVFGTPYERLQPARGGAVWPLALMPYAGLAVMLGGAVGLAERRRRRRALPLVLFFAVVLLVGIGFLPLQRLLWSVPALRLPEYARFEPAAVAALCAAAALGLDAVWRARRRRSIAAASGLAGALSLTLGARPLVVATWLLLFLAVAVAPRWRRVAWAAMLAATIIDLVPWGRRLLPRGDPALFFPRSPVIAALADAAAGGRAVGLAYLIFPSLLPVYGVAEVRAHNPLTPGAYLAALGAAFGYSPSTQQYFSAFEHADHPLLRFLGVRAVLSNVYEEQPKTLERIAPGVSQLYQVYSVPDALPRWFVPVGSALIARAEVGRWIAGMQDARRVALLSEEVGDWRPAERSWDGPAVTAAGERPGRVRLAVSGTGERLLATSLPGPFGWRARGGGARLRTVTIDGAFLGVVVPPDVSQVELRYVPPGFAVGLGACAAALAVLVGWLLVDRRRAR